MTVPFRAIVVAGLLGFASSAMAQSTPSPNDTPPAQPPVTSNPAVPQPVAAGKRMACQTGSLALKGQEKRDQMQLCMAQAHVDCLKQAIDQKIVGPQRKDFLKNCAQ